MGNENAEVITRSTNELVDLVKKGDWLSYDNLSKRSLKYCWAIYRSKYYGIPDDEVESIACFSMGKTVSKCIDNEKYWSLLATIFINDVRTYLRIKKNGIENWPYYYVSTFNDRDTENTRKVREAMKMKPKEHQTCIQLDLEGYDSKEIERNMGSKFSIKDLKYHAKLNLKKVLINHFGWKPAK